MTLGSTPQPADVVAELGESFPYTFPDARTRWLADVGVSAPITFPTSFANKTSVKVVDTVAQAASGNSHTFTGVDFGAAFAGRVLIACTFLRGSAQQALDVTSCTISGNGTTGSDAGIFGPSSDAVGAGIFAASVPSGTSGNVALSWSGQAATHAGLVLLSVASIPTSSHDNTSDAGETDAFSPATSTINIPSNGVLIVTAARWGTGNLTLSGVTEQTEFTVGSGRLAVGFNNRMNTQTGRNVSVSWSGAQPAVFVARSYAQ